MNLQDTLCPTPPDMKNKTPAEKKSNASRMAKAVGSGPLVKCTGPHKLGKGYEGYVATAPNGKTFVAEASTGAIVGDTLENVRADIRIAEASVMREQIRNAEQEAKKAEVADAAFFWSALRCA